MLMCSQVVANTSSRHGATNTNEPTHLSSIFTPLWLNFGHYRQLLLEISVSLAAKCSTLFARLLPCLRFWTLQEVFSQETLETWSGKLMRVVRGNQNSKVVSPYNQNNEQKDSIMLIELRETAANKYSLWICCCKDPFHITCSHFIRCWYKDIH